VDIVFIKENNDSLYPFAIFGLQRLPDAPFDQNNEIVFHPSFLRCLYPFSAGGQVEGTCVGTGMAFDPAFYYYRPVNVYAAHGYGPGVIGGRRGHQFIKKQSV
jgi:hypothetical protein